MFQPRIREFYAEVHSSDKAIPRNSAEDGALLVTGPLLYRNRPETAHSPHLLWLIGSIEGAMSLERRSIFNCQERVNAWIQDLADTFWLDVYTGMEVPVWTDGWLRKEISHWKIVTAHSGYHGEALLRLRSDEGQEMSVQVGDYLNAMRKYKMLRV